MVGSRTILVFFFFFFFLLAQGVVIGPEDPRCFFCWPNEPLLGIWSGLLCSVGRVEAWEGRDPFSNEIIQLRCLSIEGRVSVVAAIRCARGRPNGNVENSVESYFCPPATWWVVGQFWFFFFFFFFLAV